MDIPLIHISIIFGQTGSEVIKVSYESTPLSPSMLSLMKKQVPDPEQLKSVAAVLQKHKGYYSLYVDNRTHESLFVLDSLHSEPGVSSPGQIEFAYTNSDGEMIVKESFMKSTIIIKDKLSDIKWNISDEMKTVHERNCQNATIKKSAETEREACAYELGIKYALQMYNPQTGAIDRKFFDDYEAWLVKNCTVDWEGLDD